jgi:hypothetical protein
MAQIQGKQLVLKHEKQAVVDLQRICTRRICTQRIPYILPRRLITPGLEDLKSLRNMMKKWLSQHTEIISERVFIKSNKYKSMTQLTFKNECTPLNRLSERSMAQSLLKTGYLLYCVKAKEDIQWCDIICWSVKTRKWIIVELKSNNTDTLLDDNGDFKRLGTITSDEDSNSELCQYFRKGIRLNKIAQSIGFEGIKLLYDGQIRHGERRGIYEIDYDKKGIRNIVKVTESNCQCDK